jgi:hypothetical protein
VRLDDASTRRDGGYTLVLASLLLVPLVAAVSIAIDMGSWYARASAMHKAADSAALAGVVWLPDVSTATSVALATAERNGFDASDPDISVSVTQVGPAELEVSITDDDLPLYFADLFLDNVDLTRSAVAEYLSTVPMGSPENFLGNDPLEGESPNLWLATFGPQTTKRSGDRFHTEVCGGAIFCTGGANDEYAADGYFFTVAVDSLQAQPLTFEIFDPVHHNYGDRCTETDPANGNGGDWLFADGAVAGEVWFSSNQSGLGDYPEERYEVGGSGNPGGSAWCPGDNGLNGTNYEMTVIVRGPDNTPFNDFDNPVLCWTRWGSDQPVDQIDFVSDLLDDTGRQPVAGGSAGGASVPASASLPFRVTYREWASVCSVANPQAGSYLLQIRTNADAVNPLLWDPPVATEGRNRYSLRAGFGSVSSAGYSTGVSMFANGRLPMYVNVPPGAPSTCAASPTCFYVARVLPQYAGHELQLDVFDLTDGSSVDVKFVPPPDSGLAVFADCDFVFFAEGGETIDLSESDCEATAVANSELGNGGSNGDSIAAIISIPPDYTCNEADAFGCWVTAEMSFGGTPSDTTTWSAVLTGDPIRLVA